MGREVCVFPNVYVFVLMRGKISVEYGFFAGQNKLEKAKGIFKPKINVLL